jgi:hypothetical protein
MIIWKIKKIIFKINKEGARDNTRHSGKGIKIMKKDLQEYLDLVIENVKEYQSRSFTYGVIVYGALNYDKNLEGYFMDYDLKNDLCEYIDNYFKEYYLENLEDGRLKNMLEYADTKVYLELLDINEIQEVIENILEDGGEE